MVALTTAALASALVSAASSAYGAHKARKQAQKEEAQLQQEAADNQNDYYRNTYHNSGQSTEAQNQLAQIEREVRKANGLNNDIAVSGNKTHEQQLSSREHTNETMANAVNRIGTTATQSQQNNAQNFAANRQKIAEALRAQYRQRAQNQTNWGNNLATALSSAIATWAGTRKPQKDTNPLQNSTL